ncbi:hypothetical protein cyc_05705 [Cyclospora cayetanensis]|uniref:J domain-containing protein n=1 Tax=Cyclospora cayetanensis TaxID=88456 RepID=A0A1D3CYX7_9EIME|nr:hypothetical protein cyc_05705 [Cyclospora cayetanensis]
MPSAVTEPGKQARRCPYTVLGVPREASPRTLRRAFRRQALRCHPDKLKGGLQRGPQSCDAVGSSAQELSSGTSGHSPEETFSFLELVEAYEALTTPEGQASVESEALKKGIRHCAWVRLKETEILEDTLAVFCCRCGGELVLNPHEIRQEGPLQEECSECSISYIFYDG